MEGPQAAASPESAPADYSHSLWILNPSVLIHVHNWRSLRQKIASNVARRWGVRAQLDLGF